MLQHTLDQLASDFASRLIGALRAAPLDELLELMRPPVRALAPADAKDAPRQPPRASHAPPPATPATATATAGAAKPARAPAPARVVTRSSRAPAPSAKPAPSGKPEPSAKPEPPPAAVPDAELTAAALAYFAERGSRGATAQQVAAHLAERGLTTTADVVGALVTAGAIRDAGFRRAAGRNATAAVFVAV